jgi:geranylgeranyl diphosphate synthase type II
MMAGAILAGANQEVQQQITALGTHLGLAFQMRDDLMDLTGGDKTKSQFTDVQEGQQTYFTNYIFTNGTSEQKELLKNCL